MGTRAVVHFGDTHIATHWDGYPDSLGKDLVEILPNPTLDAVIEVCNGHDIDFATPDVREKVEMERYEKIAEKANSTPNPDGKVYTAEGLKKMHDEEGRIVQFGLHASSDNPIGTWERYGDWAEYEYVVQSDVILVQACSGSYDKPKDALINLDNFVSVTDYHEDDDED